MSPTAGFQLPTSAQIAPGPSAPLALVGAGAPMIENLSRGWFVCRSCGRPGRRRSPSPVTGPAGSCPWPSARLRACTHETPEQAGLEYRKLVASTVDGGGGFTAGGSIRRARSFGRKNAPFRLRWIDAWPPLSLDASTPRRIESTRVQPVCTSLAAASGPGFFFGEQRLTINDQRVRLRDRGPQSRTDSLAAREGKGDPMKEACRRCSLEPRTAE
jgi:hypothetical protein